jgi:hypothetical protein
MLNALIAAEHAPARLVSGGDPKRSAASHRAALFVR